MRSTARLLSVLLAGVLAVVGLTTAVPAAQAWEPPGGAQFNNPTAGKAQRWHLVHFVNDAVRHAPKGSRLLFSTFLMDSSESRNVLLAAHKRGVQVQLVMDGDDARTAKARRLARTFNRDNKWGLKGVGKDGVPLKWGKDKSFVHFCKGTCRGRGEGNLHSKFYLFTRTGSAKNVVMASSSNLNKGGAVKGWNDLYTIKNNAKALAFYAKIHALMAQDNPKGRQSLAELVTGPFTARFYPIGGGQKDPVVSDVNKIKCHGAKGGTGVGGRTKVNIAMFAWNSTRGMGLAKKVVALDRAGCDVRVVYGAPSRLVRDFLMNSARHGGIKLWDSRFDRDEDGYFDLRTHEKYMLISGVYGSNRSAREVHTGSQNWGRGTLHNGDENTLTIRLPNAYRQYLRNWSVVVKHSRAILRQTVSKTNGADTLGF